MKIVLEKRNLKKVPAIGKMVAMLKKYTGKQRVNVINKIV